MTSEKNTIQSLQQQIRQVIPELQAVATQAAEVKPIPYKQSNPQAAEEQSFRLRAQLLYCLRRMADQIGDQALKAIQDFSLRRTRELNVPKKKTLKASAPRLYKTKKDMRLHAALDALGHGPRTDKEAMNLGLALVAKDRQQTPDDVQDELELLSSGTRKEPADDASKDSSVTLQHVSNLWERSLHDQLDQLREHFKVDKLGAKSWASQPTGPGWYIEAYTKKELIKRCNGRTSKETMEARRRLFTALEMMIQSSHLLGPVDSAHLRELKRARLVTKHAIELCVQYHAQLERPAGSAERDIALKDALKAFETELAGFDAVLVGTGNA